MDCIFGLNLTLTHTITHYQKTTNVIMKEISIMFSFENCEIPSDKEKAINSIELTLKDELKKQIELPNCIPSATEWAFEIYRIAKKYAPTIKEKTGVLPNFIIITDGNPITFRFIFEIQERKAKCEEIDLKTNE